MPTYIANPPQAAATPTVMQSATTAQAHPTQASVARQADLSNITEQNAGPEATEAQPVSPNNPCPFLRGLVAQGLLPDDQASLQAVVEAIHTIERGQDPDKNGQKKPLPATAIKAIAATANGFSPVQIAHNLRHGVQLDALRHGPFDKEGAGSRILDVHGDYVHAELVRLASFATTKTDSNGQMELGLNHQQIQEMLDANAARAQDERRAVDRTIMNGEFPVLLKVLGKQGKDERYLAVKDVERLFKARQFPERIAERIGLVQK